MNWTRSKHPLKTDRDARRSLGCLHLARNITSLGDLASEVLQDSSASLEERLLLVSSSRGVIAGYALEYEALMTRMLGYVVLLLPSLYTEVASEASENVHWHCRIANKDRKQETRSYFTVLYPMFSRRSDSRSNAHLLPRTMGRGSVTCRPERVKLKRVASQHAPLGLAGFDLLLPPLRSPFYQPRIRDEKIPHSLPARRLRIG